MPYKLRLEFPGAIYHVINRGNYRRWLFEQAGAKAAFEACLLSACERCEWVLHAFNTWLAIQLGMGSPFYASKHVGVLRRHVERDTDTSRHLRLLRKVKGKA